MAQQFGSGQNAYLALVAKAASSFVEGENRSKPKKDNGFVSKLEGQAINAIGAKLLSGSDGMNATGNPRNVGHLVNKLSSWNQDKRGSGYLAQNRGTTLDGYDERRNNLNGGCGYDDSRTGGYGGGSGSWSGTSPSIKRGYGYDQGQGYGGDARWNTTGSSGWDRSGDSVGLGRQGYYDNSSYEGYGNRGRKNGGYDGSYGNPPMSRGGYSYA